MLELTLSDSTTVYLNPDAVWHVRDGGPGITAIYAHSGAALFVKGDPKSICTKLQEWKRAEVSRAPHRLRAVTDDE